MREIKFRRWNSGHGCWGDHGTLDEMIRQEWPISDDEIVEQFTGLHDKSGREIYEGDILFIERHWDDRWSGKNHVVEYRYGSFFPFGTGDWKPGEADVEVVGNIHENPELLK